MMTRAEALSLSHIHYMTLPEGVRGFVTQRRDGRYNIVVNEALSAEERAKSLEHELAHIRLDHFNREADIRTLEAEADELATAEAEYSIQGRRPSA